MINMNFVKNKLKRIVFNKLYCDVYPLINKPELCEAFNKCNLNDGSKISNIAMRILKILYSESTNCNLNIEEIKRGEKLCHFKKKVRKKDKNGNKYKERVDVIRHGFKDSKEKYEKQASVINQKQEKIDAVINHFENACVNVEDLKFVDEILLEHRLNTYFEITVLSFVVLVFLYLIFR